MAPPPSSCTQHQWHRSPRRLVHPPAISRHLAISRAISCHLAPSRAISRHLAPSHAFARLRPPSLTCAPLIVVPNSITAQPRRRSRRAGAARATLLPRLPRPHTPRAGWRGRAGRRRAGMQRGRARRVRRRSLGRGSSEWPPSRSRQASSPCATDRLRAPPTATTTATTTRRSQLPMRTAMMMITMTLPPQPKLMSLSEPRML